MFGKPNTDMKIRQGRIRWPGHVQRTEKMRIITKIFTGKLDGKRKRGRPRKRWIDDLKKNLESWVLREGEKRGG